MAARKLHHDEIHIDAALVRELLVTQFPQLCDLGLEDFVVTAIRTVEEVLVDSDHDRHG